MRHLSALKRISAPTPIKELRRLLSPGEFSRKKRIHSPGKSPRHTVSQTSKVTRPLVIARAGAGGREHPELINDLPTLDECLPLSGRARQAGGTAGRMTLLWD